MARAINIECCGGLHEFAATIGVLRAISRTAPVPGELMARVSYGMAPFEELVAVLHHAAVNGSNTVRAEDIIEEEGLWMAHAIAEDILHEMFRTPDTPGKRRAAAVRAEHLAAATATASTSSPTSGSAI